MPAIPPLGWVLISTSSVASAILIIAVCFWCWKRRRRQTISNEEHVVCYLCVKDVPMDKWNGNHRRNCSKRRKKRLEKMETPLNLHCPTCKRRLRQWPEKMGPPFKCSSKSCAILGEIMSNGANRFNCFECDFDLCDSCARRKLDNLAKRSSSSSSSNNGGPLLTPRRSSSRRSTKTYPEDKSLSRGSTIIDRDTKRTKSSSLTVDSIGQQRLSREGSARKRNPETEDGDNNKKYKSCSLDVEDETLQTSSRRGSSRRKEKGNEDLSRKNSSKKKENNGDNVIKIDEIEAAFKSNKKKSVKKQQEESKRKRVGSQRTSLVPEETSSRRPSQNNEDNDESKMNVCNCGRTLMELDPVNNT